KWWLLAVSILALFLSWGHNMMWFTELMFRIAPGYDKFRTVSMALVVLEWTLPVLAALLLAELWRGGVERTRLDKGLKWATISLGGVALFFILFGGSIFGFSAQVDSQLPTDVAEAMRTERRAMMSGDAWRSLLFVLLSAATVWAFSREKIGRRGLVAIMAVLVCADMIPVDLRFLSHDDFQPASAATIEPTAADLAIMEDQELGYRVANLAVSTFNDGTTSNFHRSVGGYHGAKLSRYQDLIDRYLSSLNTDICNMLNTKYFIVPNEQTGEPEPMFNPEANGAAWFVESIDWVKGAGAEIEHLGLMDNKRVAVADERFRSEVSGPMGDGEIALTEYYPNRLVYDYTSDEGGVAVFSEIYYDKGWTAYIDGEEAPYFRADYVLRAMELPAGSHTVEFRFRAPHYPLVAGITLTFSWVIVAGVVVAVVLMIRDKRRTNKEDGTTGEQEA
ncbi:MAG: YfhO family protein, partial [Tidjanibacter sp.]|nr:YfhO family protein [Tidjanibacter sp.]